MAMSDRQFAAAHDRYLDPPDKEFDYTTDDSSLTARCEICAHYRCGACEDSTGADGFCLSFNIAKMYAPDEMDLASIRKQEQRDWEDYQAEIYRQKKEDEQ